MSQLLKLEAGVPQGSIFTNELPQVVHEAGCLARQVDGIAMFTIQCRKWWGVCCYADHSTYTATGSGTVRQAHHVMPDFLTANKL